jgi:hypothetical protein
MQNKVKTTMYKFVVVQIYTYIGYVTCNNDISQERKKWILIANN